MASKSQTLKKAFALLCAGAFLFSCGRKSEIQWKEIALEKLRSGETVRTIEEALPPSFQPGHETESIADSETISDVGIYGKLRDAVAPLLSRHQELQQFKKSRSSFSDAELEELLIRVRAVNSTAHSAAGEITRIVSGSGKTESPRLSLIREATQDRGAFVERLEKHFDLPAEHSTLPLFPYGIPALLPKSGQEEKPFSRASNPFLHARTAWLNYFDDPEALAERFERYRAQRALDNPARRIAPPAAASVAFVDTGIDYVKLPELAPFLGESRDFADGDDNPWLPLMGAFSHGSATTTTFLSMIARLEPEQLEEGRIEIRMWKWQSLRQLLSRYAGEHGISRDDTTWESRNGASEAILSERTSEPRVLVVPMGLSLRNRLMKTENPGRLKSSTSLWVMAAGNAGADARASAPAACLLDLPAEFRPRDNVLCVGAARIGAHGPEIAEYSNHGPGVEVYVLDNFNAICPSGTSCAAPAMGAAAAMLVAKYPQLPAKSLRTILRRASQLQVQGPRRWRYFDPMTMMPRAYEMAEKLIARSAARPFQRTLPRSQLE